MLYVSLQDDHFISIIYPASSGYFINNQTCNTFDKADSRSEQDACTI